ncbi:MAG: MarR family transcriptional regulator, partial [Anaerotignum sp.]|nr:MarR family transcriptional regulator [Anaerotignum sp.]
MKYKNINKSQCHCITIRRATNAMTDYYDAALRELNLTTSQYSLLKNLYRLETASTSELAEHVNLDRSTLVRNLKPLLERELIVDLAQEKARNHKFMVSAKG